MVGLACQNAEIVECISSAGSVWYSYQYIGVKLCCEIFIGAEHGSFGLFSMWKTVE